MKVGEETGRGAGDLGSLAVLRKRALNGARKKVHGYLRPVGYRKSNNNISGKAKKNNRKTGGPFLRFTFRRVFAFKLFFFF